MGERLNVVLRSVVLLRSPHSLICDTEKNAILKLSQEERHLCGYLYHTNTDVHQTQLLKFQSLFYASKS